MRGSFAVSGVDPAVPATSGDQYSLAESATPICYFGRTSSIRS